jgi:hypothetical protein
MEFRCGTNPLVADTDGDGLSDSAEVYTYGTNPLAADTDGDGVSDYNEVYASPPTDPLKADHGTTGGPAVYVAAPQPASFILW